MTSFAVTAIGKVESPLTQPESAPRQPDEGAPAAWLVFEPEVLEGLQSIRPGDELVLVTWLDRARRDVLTVHPRGDRARKQEGVFSTRSSDRPNPIDLHDVVITAVDGRRLGRVAIQFDRGFSDALAYGAASFDRVFSSFMFHHLERRFRRIASEMFSAS